MLISSTAADFGELDPPDTLTFTSIQSVDCVNLLITDDSISEPTEFFSVNLTSTEFQVIVNVDSAIVFIAANDGKIWSPLQSIMRCSVSPNWSTDGQTMSVIQN